MYTPKLLDELDQPGCQPERFLVLRDAQVIVADYPLIFSDFPWLTRGRTEAAARAAADAWLLENAAVISEAQAAQSVTNTPIAVRDGASVDGVRPPRHGRSALVEARHHPELQVPPGLLSVKGLGVAPGVVPAVERARNGLLRLHCALYEFLMHRLVSAALRHAGSVHRVLPAYAVLDAGFDEVELGTGCWRPSGLLVRRANLRAASGFDLPSGGSRQHAAVTEVEFTLRSYGITSADQDRPWLVLQRADGQLRLKIADRPVEEPTQAELEALQARLGGGEPLLADGINVQTTANTELVQGGCELVDLQHYFAGIERFQRPVVGVVRDRAWGVGPALLPDHACFVQPQEALRVGPCWAARLPTPQEARALEIPADVPESGVVLGCLRAALSAREGDLGSVQALSALLDETIESWPAPAAGG